jgi:hypothetical protein
MLPATRPVRISPHRPHTATTRSPTAPIVEIPSMNVHSCIMAHPAARSGQPPAALAEHTALRFSDRSLGRRGRRVDWHRPPAPHLTLRSVRGMGSAPGARGPLRRQAPASDQRMARTPTCSLGWGLTSWPPASAPRGRDISRTSRPQSAPWTTRTGMGLCAATCAETEPRNVLPRRPRPRVPMTSRSYCPEAVASTMVCPG